MVTSAKKRGTPFEETEAGHLPDCNHTRIFDLRTMKRQFLFFCLHTITNAMSNIKLQKGIWFRNRSFGGLFLLLIVRDAIC